MPTGIRASYVVGFDEDQQDHVLYRDGEVVFDGDRVVHAGPAGYAGEVDAWVDASGCLAGPGLIDMHALMDVGIHPLMLDQKRAPGMIRPRDWVFDPERTPAFTPDEVRDGATYTMTSMLRSGVTTFCGITAMVFKRWHDPDWEPDVYARTAGELGLRAYLSHHYRSCAPYVEPDGGIGWAWDETQGFEGLERNLAFHERWSGTYDGRIQALLFPYTCDQASRDLMLATRRAADEHGLRMRMHFAQSRTELDEIARRADGRTPVEYLDDLGVLGPDVMLTHCLLGRGHDGGPGLSDDELATLADSGVTVTNCPWIYSMRGAYLDSFARYRDAGVNMCIGTDTQPDDLLREMRFAAIMGKVAEGATTRPSARDVYHAVTLSAARFLGRDDIGRLRPGAKADVMVLDLQRLALGPTHDPIRSLVYFASMADVRDVWVDGVRRVADHRGVGFDDADVVARAQPVGDKVRATLTRWDRLGRDATELYPPTFAVR